MAKVELTQMREGFWYSKVEFRLPMPVANSVPWPDQENFVTKLLEVEKVAKVTRYRGWSTCRLCGKSNGSEEYEHNNWVWPSGFLHYVTDHNVRPSLAFQEFILGDWVKGKSWPEQEKDIVDRALQKIMESEDQIFLELVNRIVNKDTGG